MRVLTISNLYPPHFIGGYELGCRDVMQGLVQRGHKVRVLTSTWQVPRDVIEDDGPIKVHRALQNFISLPQEPTGAKLWLMNKHNRAILQRAVKHFRPDLIYIWNLAGLPFRLALDAQQTKISLCCYISDLWLSRWQNEGAEAEKTHETRKNSLLFGDLRPQALSINFRRVQCTSAFIKEATMRPDSANQSAIYEVIHWGVKTEKFHENREIQAGSRPISGPRRLIYAGQLAPHKGVSTVIEAVQILKQDGAQISLTIAGPVTYGNHGDELRAIVQRLNLQAEIEFLGPVEREKLPDLLAAHEIFVFPAVWDEPFSIGLLEAMAAGLGVVSTTTGGSKEIVRHTENALAFSAGDAADCATQIKRLLDDAALLEKVSSNARRNICEKFTMAQMIQRIEKSLQEAAKA